MKILPITNNNIQNRNISSKGTVGTKVTDSLRSYSKTFAKNAELAAKDPQTFQVLPIVLKAYTAKAKTYADNILHNMNLIMSRFAKDCVLNYDFNAINPDRLHFYINNSNSDYIKTCGSANIAHGNFDEDFKEINAFVYNNLVEINPFDTNRDFKIQSKVTNNNFAPERVFMDLESRLVYMKEGLPPEAAIPENKITIGALLDEMNEFEEKFSDDDVHMLWFNV